MALSTAATPVRDNPLMDRRPGRVIDVVLVTLFVVDGLSAGAGASRLPIAELAGALLVLVAAFRRPQRHLPEFGAVALLGGAILIYLGVISAINDVDEADVWRRLIRVALLMTLIGAFASRRIDLRAGLQGLVIALAVNIPLFYSGIAPDTYGGVLTGLLGDKNVAGMYYAAMPVLLMATTRNRRVPLGVPGVGRRRDFPHRFQDQSGCSGLRHRLDAGRGAAGSRCPDPLVGPPGLSGGLDGREHRPHRHLR